TRGRGPRTTPPRRHDRRGTTAACRPPRRDAGGNRRAPADRCERGQREGLDRQSRRRRGRRPDRLGPCGRGRGIGRMTIRLQDTMSGETRPLEPLEAGHVRIYSCGPTVYGAVHIGNFRSFLYADVLVRYLRYRGLRVTWVMNITDVDDKIIRGAAAAGVGIGELADRWRERFLADAAALRMTRPDILPRATEHIDDMVRLIETLLANGHAY